MIWVKSLVSPRSLEATDVAQSEAGGSCCGDGDFGAEKLGMWECTWSACLGRPTTENDPRVSRCWHQRRAEGLVDG